METYNKPFAKEFMEQNVYCEEKLKLKICTNSNSYALQLLSIVGNIYSLQAKLTSSLSFDFEQIYNLN